MKGLGHPAHSNAVQTKMFTECKRCGNSNGNGYQYCTACHGGHKRRSPKRRAATTLQLPIPARSVRRGASATTQLVDLDDLIRECGIEL